MLACVDRFGGCCAIRIKLIIISYACFIQCLHLIFLLPANSGAEMVALKNI